MAIEITKASRQLLIKECQRCRQVISNPNEPEHNRELARVHLSKLETEIACRELRKENYLRNKVSYNYEKN